MCNYLHELIVSCADEIRRAERIEELKAKKRKIATQNNNTAKAECLNSDGQIGRTDDIVAKKLDSLLFNV